MSVAMSQTPVHAFLPTSPPEPTGAGPSVCSRPVSVQQAPQCAGPSVCVDGHHRGTQGSTEEHGVVNKPTTHRAAPHRPLCAVCARPQTGPFTAPDGAGPVVGGFTELCSSPALERRARGGRDIADALSPFSAEECGTGQFVVTLHANAVTQTLKWSELLEAKVSIIQTVEVDGGRCLCLVLLFSSGTEGPTAPLLQAPCSPFPTRVCHPGSPQDTAWSPSGTASSSKLPGTFMGCDPSGGEGDGGWTRTSSRGSLGSPSRVMAPSRWDHREREVGCGGGVVSSRPPLSGWACPASRRVKAVAGLSSDTALCCLTAGLFSEADPNSPASQRETMGMFRGAGPEPHAIIKMRICCGNAVAMVDPPEPLFTAPDPGSSVPCLALLGLD
ncbi:unnamed protein product [Gadus morhua 'NCC']